MKRAFVEVLAPLLVLALLWACHSDDREYARYAQASALELKQRGVEHLDAGRVDSALTYFTLAAGKYRPEMPDSVKKACAAAANNAGYIYMFHLRDYPSAYTWLLRAVEMAEEAGNTSTPAYAYLNIGNIYITYKDAGAALRYHKMAFDRAVQAKNWPVVVTVVSNLISMRQQMDPKPDISEVLAAFDRLDIPPTTMLEYTRTQHRALEAMERGDHAAALGLTRRAAALVDTPLSPERYLRACRIQEAGILAKTGLQAQALEMIDQEATRATSGSELEAQADIAKLKSEIYASMNRPEQALACMKLAQTLSDSLFQSQNYGDIRDLGANFALNKLNARVAQVEQRRRRTATALVAAGIVIVLLAGAGALFYSQNRKLRFSNRQLFERNQQVIAMSEDAVRSRRLYMGKIDQLEGGEAPTEASRLGQRDDFERQKLLDKINAVLDDVEAISSTDFSLSQLAKAVGSNHNYVSQAVNDGFGKNFSAVLAEKRIRQACIRLSDNARYGNLTVEAIANGLGFRSRSNFASLFKKVTGLTPTEYRKLGSRD